MRKTDLNSDQLRDLGVFHVILEAAGWKDEDGVEALFDRGESVSPEGERFKYLNSRLAIYAQFHAPVRMISLIPRDVHTGEEQVGVHILYTTYPAAILELIVSAVDASTPETFLTNILNDVEPSPDCQILLIGNSDGELFEYKS